MRSEQEAGGGEEEGRKRGGGEEEGRGRRRGGWSAYKFNQLHSMWVVLSCLSRLKKCIDVPILVCGAERNGFPFRSSYWYHP